jgi:hypothetical protein
MLIFFSSVARRVRPPYLLYPHSRLAETSPMKMWDTRRGKKSNPTLTMILTLAEALEVSVEELIGF